MLLPPYLGEGVSLRYTSYVCKTYINLIYLHSKIWKIYASTYGWASAIPRSGSCAVVTGQPEGFGVQFLFGCVWTCQKQQHPLGTASGSTSLGSLIAAGPYVHCMCSSLSTVAGFGWGTSVKYPPEMRFARTRDPRAELKSSCFLIPPGLVASESIIMLSRL